MSDPTQQASVIEGWREHSLDVLLRRLRVLVPVLVLASLTLRGGLPLANFASYVHVGAGLLFAALPSLPLGVRARAWTVVVTMVVTGAVTLLPWGLLPGPSLLFLIATLFAGLFLGRAAALLVIATIPVTYLGIGLVVVHGFLPVNTSPTAPHLLGNWLRVGLVLAVVSVFVGLVIDQLITHVERGHRALRQTNEELQELLHASGTWHRHIERAKDDERRQLSRELHDELGQSLTALALRIGLLARSGSTPAAEHMVEARALIDDLIGRVRRIAVDLRPPLLDELGLESALQACVQAQGRGGPACTLETVGLEQRFAPEIEMVVFRVVQEALTNAARHAGAASIHVSVRVEGEAFAISVLDDGGGVAPELARERAKAGHLGLVGMRERVRALGGEFALSSPPSSGEPTGTRIDVRLPTRPPAGLPDSGGRGSPRLT